MVMCKLKEILLMQIKVKELYENKNYIDATKEGLKISDRVPDKFRNYEKFAYYFLSLQYSLLSAYELKLYVDVYKISDALFNIVPINSKEPPCDEHNFICLLERFLEASIYCLINNEENYIDKVSQIIFNLEMRYKSKHMKPNELFKKCKKIYEDYNLKKFPYYEIEVSINFHIPVNDGEYKINNLNSVEAITVKRITRNIETDLVLNFTRLKIRTLGFINAVGDWKGAKADSLVELYNTVNAMKVINEFLIIVSRINNNNYYPRVYAEQVDTHIITQYLNSGEVYHWSSYSNFGRDTLQQGIRNENFNDEQSNELINILLGEKLKMHEKLVILGKSDISVGLYTEAFMILNSAIEAQVYFLTHEISELLGKEKEFLDFIKPTSKCDICELKKQNSQYDLKNIAMMPPSIFGYSDYLLKINTISKKQAKELKSYISKGRNDSLRNELMHGRTAIVKINEVKMILNMIDKIDGFFESIRSNIHSTCN